MCESGLISVVFTPDSFKIQANPPEPARVSTGMNLVTLFLEHRRRARLSRWKKCVTPHRHPRPPSLVAQHTGSLGPAVRGPTGRSNGAGATARPRARTAVSVLPVKHREC